MEKWIKRRKEISRVETAAIVVAILLLLIGGVCDVAVKMGYILIHVKGFEDVSLAVLQMQASITVLTLSIIALLSGNISDSYMGVSVSSYFLEKRPPYLKQKRFSPIYKKKKLKSTDCDCPLLSKRSHLSGDIENL